MLLLLKQLIMLKSIQGKAFAPAPRRKGRGSSGRGVLSYIVYVLCVKFFYEWNCWLDYMLL